MVSPPYRKDWPSNSLLHGDRSIVQILRQALRKIGSEILLMGVATVPYGSKYLQIEF